MPPYPADVELVTRCAPGPLGDAPPVVATVQTFPAQSVTDIASLEFGCCALICSTTICASKVADVSLLFRLSVAIARTSKLVSAPMPTARIEMATINSMRVMPAWDRRGSRATLVCLIPISVSHHNLFQPEPV